MPAFSTYPGPPVPGDKPSSRQMAHYPVSVIPPLGTPVTAAQRQNLFQRYRDFCEQHVFDHDYPIDPDALKAFCSTFGIGKKSRKARKWRRWVNDLLSSAARIHAGVQAKSGPPKGPPDEHGRRHYYTLDACRRGGRHSGAVRRFNTRHRDSRIREAVFKHGMTRAAAARQFGVCPTTVTNVLQRRPFVKGPGYAPQHGFQKPPTNILRQTAVMPERSEAPAAVAEAGPVPTATGPPTVVPSGADTASLGPETALPLPGDADPFVPAQPGLLPDMQPMPRRIPLSRTYLALKMHWKRLAEAQLPTITNQRMKSIRTEQVKSLDKEIDAYIRKIAQSEGKEHAQRVRDASEGWLDALTDYATDPVILLLHYNRDTRSKHQRRP